MEPFYGKPYELVKTENFDEFLKYLDIGYFQRQVALTLRPVQYLVRNGDGTFTLHFKSVAVLYQLQFVPGVEFDETKPDGVKVRGLITIRGNKLYHRQVEACGRTIHHVYEFYKDKMTITLSPNLLIQANVKIDEAELRLCLEDFYLQRNDRQTDWSPFNHPIIHVKLTAGSLILGTAVTIHKYITRFTVHSETALLTGRVIGQTKTPRLYL